MDSIFNNPFRIIGLSANCTGREIQRQRAKLTALSNIKKEIITDFDFTPLPGIKRNTESLNSAFSQIENPQNRIIYALFWFTVCGNSDELAFQCLASGRIEKALEIWHTIVESASLTSRKISALNNLSTLNFLNAFSDSQIELSFFRQAIGLKLMLFETDYFEKFRELVLPNKEKISFDEVTKQFSTMLVTNLENNFSHNCNSSELAIDVSEIAEIAEESPINIQESLLEVLATDAESKIENALTEIERRREDDYESVIALGEELYRRTRKPLKALKSILGIRAIRYEMIADKISLEVLSCAVEYFNSNNEEMINAPFWRTLRLFRRAALLAVSESVKEKIALNISNVEEWEEGTEEERKFSEVEAEIEQIKSNLDNFQTQTATSANASGLVIACRPLLKILKEKLGADDEFYIQLSSIVVRNSQGMMAEALNSAHENFLEAVNNNYYKEFHLKAMETALADAKRLSNLLLDFSMNAETRQQYQKNNTALHELNELYAPIFSAQRQRVSNSVSSRTQTNLSSPKQSVAFSPKKTKIRNLVWASSLITVSLGFFIIIGLLNNGSNFSTYNSKFSNNKSNNKSNANVNSTPIPANVKITRPKNGETLFIASGSKGYGSLFIENNTETDAIAKLVDLSSGKTYQQVFIQSRSRFEIKGVKSGNYNLMFSLGKNYSPDAKKFLTNESFEKFDETLDFTARRNGGRIEWMNYNASLGKTVGGNARTSPISAADFADK